MINNYTSTLIRDFIKDFGGLSPSETVCLLVGISGLMLACGLVAAVPLYAVSKKFIEPESQDTFYESISYAIKMEGHWLKHWWESSLFDLFKEALGWEQEFIVALLQCLGIL